MAWPPRPEVAFLIAASLAGTAACAQPAALASTGPVALGASPTRVEIPATPALAQSKGASLALALSGLTTDRQPGVLYRVATGNKALGYINFYNATGGSPAFTFALGQGVETSAGLVVTITPAAPPDPAAHPQIGRISVINQARP